MVADHLARTVVDVADFPEPGIVFKDITPLLADPVAFAAVVDKVVGMEARGFILAAPVALALGTGFVPVRKAGKLPRETHAVSYALEYGEATLELHTDALQKGHRVLIVDDLLATGGTADAAAKLVGRQGAVVAGYQFVIELGFLDGGKRLGPTSRALVRY